MENDNHENYRDPRNTGRRGVQGEAKTKSLLWPHSIGIRGATLLEYKKGLKRPTLAWNEMPFATVVKASASRATDPGLDSRLRRNFSGSSHTRDLKTGTPVATLAGAWQNRVSAGTGWPGFSILWLGETESLICIFFLSQCRSAYNCLSVPETH